MSHSITDEKIELLQKFIERDKFSVQAWNDRGLNPSDNWLCESLKKGFDSTAGSLIDAIRQNKKNSHLKDILIQSLSDCKKISIDREEKEFASDLYYELSQIIDVDIRFNLNVFLYGYALVFLLKTIKFLKPEKVHQEYKKNVLAVTMSLVYK